MACARHIGELGVAQPHHQVRVDQPLSIPGRLSNARHLTGDADSICGVIRPPGGPVAAGQGVAEGGGVVGRPRHVHGLPAEGIGLRPLLGCAPPGAGQPRQEADTKQVIGATEVNECLLEQRDQPRVVSRAEPREPSSDAERGSGQLRRRSDALRDLCRLEERRARPGDVAASRLGIPARQEDLEPRPRIGPGDHPVQSQESQAIESIRLLEGERARRLLPCAPRIVDRLLARRLIMLRVVEVIRELRQVGFRRGAVQSLETIGDTSVQVHALARRQLVVERLAYEVVREAVPAHGCARSPQQEAFGGCLVECVAEYCGVEIAGGAEEVDAEFRTDGGTDGQDAPRLLRQSRQAPADDRADPGGNGDVLRGPEASSSSRPSAESRRTASPTYNGLPFVPRARADTRRSSGAVPTAAKMKSRSALFSRPFRRRVRVMGSRASSAMAGVSGCSGVSSTSR